VLGACGSAGKALAFAVFDQLVIGHTLLVSLGACLVQLRVSSLALRLILGHSRAMFGRLGAFLADTRLVAMMSRDSLTALLQLALTSPDAHTG
jgi:hypothetical protein